MLTDCSASLHGIVGHLEMPARPLVVSAAELHFAKGRTIEGIPGEPIAMSNGFNGSETELRPVALCNRNG
jgi:hypothetical protein